MKAPNEVERCEVCDWPYSQTGCQPGSCAYRPAEGTEEYRRVQERRRKLGVDQLQPTPAEPRIETVPDEQAAFEKWCLSTLESWLAAMPQIMLREIVDGDVRYKSGAIQAKWQGWQGRARAGSSLIAEPEKSKLTTFVCDCGRKLLVEGQVIGKGTRCVPTLFQTVKKLCGHEFKLKDGYFCELPHGHAGGHEATCPNPQFHQSWPNENCGHV